MAKKGGSKETFTNESPEQRMSEQKQKISRIHDQFPQCTRDQISKVLAYYKGDESEAIYAITKDGGEEALTNSMDIENLKTKNNRNKKKKKKSKKEMVVPSASFDADDSSSLHSSSNVDVEVEKDSSKIEEGLASDVEIKNVEARLSDPENLKSAQSETFPNDQSPKPRRETVAKPPNEIHVQPYVLEEQSSNREIQNKNSSNNLRDGGSIPRDGGSNPRDGGSNPRDGGSNPRDGDSNPRDGSSKLRGGGSSPRDGDSKLRGGGNSPRDGDSKLRGGGNSPRDGDSKLRGGGNSPRDGDSKLRGGGNSPRDGDSKLRGGGSSPRDGDSKLRGGGSSPRDGDSSPRDGGSSMGGSPESGNSEKREKVNQRNENFRTNEDESHSKYVSRQRTGNFHRSKTSSISEDPASQSSPQPALVAKGRIYDKCKKDLSRQTTSLNRIEGQLPKNLEDSAKRIKNSFQDIRQMLDKRQELLEQEMEKTTQEALSVLKNRQDEATELKKRVDRGYLSESEWASVRSDIKQYVTERKYDEELATPAWFEWSMEAITEVVNTFGKVRVVKNVYSQRSHTLLDSSCNVEPSPSSSIANEEINSTSDRNDNDASEAIENLPSAEKEVRPYMKSQPQGENRSTRIFSNSSFGSNADGGRYSNQGNRARRYNAARGPSRGGRYQNYNKNYGNNNGNYYGNYEHQPEYRNHPPSNRPPRHYPSRPPHAMDQSEHSTATAANNKMTPFHGNERNLNSDNRNNEKYRGRGGGHPRPQGQRNTSNMGPPRSSSSVAEGNSPTSKPEPVILMPENMKDNDNNTEKQNAINGY